MNTTILKFLLALAVVVSVNVQAQTVLRIGNVGEPKTLDPHFVSGVWENRIVGDLFMGLTTEGPDASTIPGAAESWTVSDDGLVYTFKLRAHNWSDGTPVSAEDFVYSMRRILLPATAAEYASLLYTIKNAEAVNSGKAAPEELAVKALDEQTLEITLEAPAPFFIDQLTHYTAFPVPRHVVEKYGNDWVKKGNIVSNGPYVLNEWIPNTHVILDKNPEFYDAANVMIDQVYFDPNEDRSAVQKSFRAGELDIAKDFASDQIDWLRENLPQETHIAPYLGIYYYPINTSKAPFNDKRVRQALSMALNREAITDKVLKTGEVPAYSFVPPGTGNYAAGPSYVSWKDVPYAERVEQAKALLAEAGFGPDNPLQFTLSYNTSENHKRIAIAASAMWKQIGVQAELFNSEVKVHYDRLKQADFDIARAGWIADYNDPQNFLYLLETRTGP
ncbi:MAG: peptide ABC transporter substrate-binding protein, partial [Candidatus Competibacteraceae bacterium]|nr:peptide ABC transporter substrate-binding protein [Candidatus Competibacteraceae bacterium]